MKRDVVFIGIAVFCFVISVILCPAYANAQSLKLGVEGLTFNEDSVKSKDILYAHSVVSVKKHKNSNAIIIGGSRRSSIRPFELGWNMADREIPGDFFDIYSWRSNQVTINPFNLSATNRQGTFGLSMALGIRANNYMFNDAVTMEKVGGMVNPISTKESVRKSKFTTAAIHIPMELTFGRPYRLAFSVGGFADLAFNSHTKVKYGSGKKDKVHRFPVNFLQAGFSARISCKYLSLYCNWYPGGIFKDGCGPKMQVWSVGIGI